MRSDNGEVDVKILESCSQVNARLLMPTRSESPGSKDRGCLPIRRYKPWSNVQIRIEYWVVV
jgi:hypothetical protein